MLLNITSPDSDGVLRFVLTHSDASAVVLNLEHLQPAVLHCHLDACGLSIETVKGDNRCGLITTQL